jgi:hypothetical protein
MKKFIIIILCICTISCVFESCRGNSGKAVIELLTKIKPPKPPKPPKLPKPPLNLTGIIETEGARIARIKRGNFKSITEVAEHFKLNKIKSGQVEFQNYSMNDVKVIITKNGISEVKTLSAVKQILFNSAFKVLDYSKAKYVPVENAPNLIMVTIPYYTRLGYLKSYVTFKINEGNLSKIKKIISKLSSNELNPYSKFEHELKSANISIKDIKVVHYIEDGVIAENYLEKKSNERYNISPDAA